LRKGKLQKGSRMSKKEDERKEEEGGERPQGGRVGKKKRGPFREKLKNIPFERNSEEKGAKHDAY